MKYLVALLFCVFTISFLPTEVNAISFGGYFGGRVVSTAPCLDGATTLVVVGPPVPGVFVYVQGSVLLYNRMAVLPQRWVIGSYMPGGVCVTPVGPAPVQGTIRQIGTS